MPRILLKTITLREVEEQYLDKYLDYLNKEAGFRLDKKMVKAGRPSSWSDDFGYTKATTTMQIVGRKP